MLQRKARKPQVNPFFKQLYEAPDALGLIHAMRRHGDYLWRMQLGLQKGAWSFTDPRTHTLVVGPSQGSAGKSSAIQIPTVLSHYGPALATTSKWDVAQATAMARSRLGTVWWYDPSGDPAPPGFKELRFCPITGAKDWTVARETAKQMMKASSTNANKGATVNEVSHHFQFRGGDFLSVLLHVADACRLDMDWVIAMITSMDFSKDGQLEGLLEAMETLPVDIEATRILAGIINTEARERSGILSTVAVTVSAYHGKALRVARDVNFDPVAFVVGDPNDVSDLRIESTSSEKHRALANAGIYPRLQGRYDTIYVSLPNDKQEIYAPLLVILVDAIRRAAYAVARHDQRQGWYGRPPTLLALDEMYGCPIPGLPTWLADASSQGILICGALQDLSQARARWGEAGKGFLTLWQNVIVMRGARDRETVDLLSMLGGQYDHIKSSYSEIQDKPGRWSEGISSERRPWLPPEMIAGGDPSRPGEELVFTPGGHWSHFKPVKYFEGFWTTTLIQSAEWTLKDRPANHVLPLPDLARGGDYRALHAVGGPGVTRWFDEVRERQRRAVEAA
jgi:type IV secretory pathway TraG/TraD family ATPase VirD4